MKRLITFGCSITSGVGLPDPKTQTWGAVVSNHLNLILVNKGIHGASNKLICHEVLNFNFEPSDTVIILWTYEDRYTKFFNKDKYFHFFPSFYTKLNKSYYKDFHTDYDSKFTNKLYINHILYFLTNKKLKFYFAGINYKYLNSFTEHNDNNIPVDFQYFSLRYPKASDNLHTGVQGNLAYGNKMAEEIFLMEKNYHTFKPLSPKII